MGAHRRFLKHRQAIEALALATALTAGILLILRFAGGLANESSGSLTAGVEITPARRASLASFRPLLSSLDSLRDPPTLLFGAHDTNPDGFPGVAHLEQGLELSVPIVSFNVAWGERPEHQFPLSALRQIDAAGSVAMITWEPWVTNFSTTEQQQLPPASEREFRSLAAIARGAYDFYISRWAAEAQQFRKPIFLRFAHEMNDPYRHLWGPQNGNRPEDFIAAWRHVHFLFQNQKATNVLWVWSPRVSLPFFEYYFPGSPWVDWIGLETLNYGTTEPWSRWWSLDQMLERPYATLAALEKPLMITEFGTVSVGGDMASWYREAFESLGESYGRVRALIFVGESRGPFDLLRDRRATQLVAEEILRSRP